MDFETLIGRFKFIFNFFGLSVFDAHANVLTRWISKISAIIYFLILAGLFPISIYFRYKFSSFAEIIFTIITYMHMSSEILLQFTIIGQALFFSKNFVRLRSLYEFIQKYMRTRIGHSLEFNDFQKRIYCVTVLVMIPHMVTLIMRLTPLRLQFNTVFMYIQIIFYFLSSLVELHIILQVELLQCFLKLTTHWLQTLTPTFSAISLYQRNVMLKIQQTNGYDEIRHMKLIYFKLWEISTNINRIFGWSLVAIILRNFVEMAYGAYWVYLFSTKNLEYVTLLRMYLYLPKEKKKKTVLLVRVCIYVKSFDA